MSTFVRKVVPELVISVVVGSLGSYGLDALYPSPDRAFLVVACTATLCASAIIRDYVNKTGQKLAIKYGHYDANEKLKNPIFNQLCTCILTANGLFLPLMARYVGQNTGYWVPNGLQMIGYTAVVGSLFWITKNIVDMAQDSYYRYYSSPAVK